jgi:predicted  nucleic acid-binding Zn-ribbon protein
MDDKTFELFEKMYNEIQGIKSNMSTKDDIANMGHRIDELEANMSTKDDMANMGHRIDGLEANMSTKNDIAKIHQILVVLENKMDENHKALYDGYKLTYEKLGVLEERVNEIDKKLERHDVEIRVIKGVK